MSFNKTSSELKYIYYVENDNLECVVLVEVMEFIYTSVLLFGAHIYCILVEPYEYIVLSGDMLDLLYSINDFSLILLVSSINNGI